MNNKRCAVIGMGLFGLAVAKTLAKNNCEVMVVDNDEEKLQEIADLATYAICADVTEPAAWNAIDLENIDVAIIAISENMEASVIAAMHVLEKNVPHVIGKAISDIHGRVLEKLGVHEVIHPEREIGRWVANNLTSKGVASAFDLSDVFSIVEIEIPKTWQEKSLMELKIREKYNINFIGYKVDDDINLLMDPKKKLPAECKVILVGNNVDLQKVLNLK